MSRSGVAVSGPSAGTPSSRPQQRRLADRPLAGIGAPRYRRFRVPPVVPGRGNESFALSRNGAGAAVVVLDDVRVQRLVRQEHEKRVISGLPYEPDRVIRQQVGDVAGFPGPRAVDVELRIEGLALAAHRDPMGKSRPRAVVVSHVPLAEKSRPVTRLLQRDRERVEPVARGVARGVVDDAVGVGVLAGQDAGAARRAQGRRREGVQEPHAFTRHPVDRGRLDERMTRDGEVIPAQVVDQDDHEAGASLGGLAARRARRKQKPAPRPAIRRPAGRL